MRRRRSLPVVSPNIALSTEPMLACPELPAHPQPIVMNERAEPGRKGQEFSLHKRSSIPVHTVGTHWSQENKSDPHKPDISSHSHR
jgi:hypothetical protein